METALIETSPCGYVKPRIVDIIDDLPNWSHSFLVAFYVDRVVHCRRRVPRAIPRIKGWTSTILSMREGNEMKEMDFGLGHVSGQHDTNELESAEKNKRVDDVELPLDGEMGNMRVLTSQISSMLGNVDDVLTSLISSILDNVDNVLTSQISSMFSNVDDVLTSLISSVLDNIDNVLTSQISSLMSSTLVILLTLQ
ncbi:hypothetical protein AAHA92_31443 [Salvia divinorum]|uniref:Uncharacterized protein n=1 Tax=Salvia divinorum TaxID=28513 RepID=A0ABD1FSX2_SALDI